MADTPATVFLKSHKVAYTEHEYECVERTILELPKIYINAGRRGFLVGLAPGELVRTLAPVLVMVALEN